MNVALKPWNAETLEWAQDSFRMEVDDLGDDPSHLISSYRDEEPKVYFDRMRRIAVDLSLDFDALLARLPPYERQRLRDIETGVVTPAPKRDDAEEDEE